MPFFVFWHVFSKFVRLYVNESEMTVNVVRVTSKRQLRKFIGFNLELYKDNPYSVPALFFDEMNTLDPKRNAAFEFCEAEYYLAYKADKLVGRVAAIINTSSNTRWNVKAVRFGWLDFIDDLDVSKALLETVSAWGRQRGMTTIQGPLGFSDLDREGMLVEGFDQLATQATSYNYPYYPIHLQKLGYSKVSGWIEKRLTVPDEVPPRHVRLSEMIKERYHLHSEHYPTTRELVKKRGIDIFNLVNESYRDLVGYSALSDRQIKQYSELYMPLVDHRMVCLVADENDRLVGLGVSMPSVSEALQKARGRLMPFGWWYLFKALFVKHPDTLDLLLVAVASDYRNKGVNSIMMAELVKNYIEMGFKWAETTLELEDNVKVQAMWTEYKPKIHKRHTLFSKNLQ